jgi:FkbM family methyltransferase
MTLRIDELLLNSSRENRSNLVKLKEEQLPVYVYGEGEYSVVVNKFLKDNFVHSISTFTSSGLNLYSKGGNFEFCDKPFNIVIGLADQLKARKLLDNLKSKIENCINVYYFALNPFYNVEENLLLENGERINLVLKNLNDIESKEILLNYLKSAISWSSEYLNPILPQYFPAFFHLSDSEIVVDGGAYIGDTLAEYQDKFGAFKEYHAFEPSFNNYLQLSSSPSLENMYKYNKGLGMSNSILLFNDGVAESSTSSFINSAFNQDNLREVQIVRLDDVIDEVTFIKLDIEGAELDALVGSASLISCCKPKIAVCIYHKFEHLWQIQEFLTSIRSDYRFSIRYHSVHRILTELVLYAY